jgi:hypothetical protein
MNGRFAPRTVIQQLIEFSVFAYQSATDSISAEIASVNENHVHLGPKLP